jgi:hypothetical protein
LQGIWQTFCEYVLLFAGLSDRLHMLAAVVAMPITLKHVLFGVGPGLFVQSPATPAAQVCLSTHPHRYPKNITMINSIPQQDLWPTCVAPPTPIIGQNKSYDKGRASSAESVVFCPGYSHSTGALRAIPSNSCGPAVDCVCCDVSPSVRVMAHVKLLLAPYKPSCHAWYN